MNWPLRLAIESDIPALEELIPLSVRSLQGPWYSPAQMEAAFGPVYGVDRQLIKDGTFFAVEDAGCIVGCGGWSRRKSFFGGDACRGEPDPELNPATDPARLRAFFVRPGWERRGIGRCIVEACESAITAAGFQRIELSATLAGEALYASAGYEVFKRYEIPMRDGLTLPVLGMTKNLSRATL